MKKHPIVYICVGWVICMMMGLFGIALAERQNVSPYERLPIITSQGVAEVDVILNLKQFLKDHGDDSRLLRYVDADAKVVIYLTLNSTGDMFTSMQVKTFAELSGWCDLRKRYEK